MSNMILPAPSVSAIPRVSAQGATLLVTFSIERQWYALPLEAVLQVVRLPALLHLAGAPPILCGMLNLHGQYLPVLSGRSLMDAPVQYELNNQIIVVGQMDAQSTPRFGLLVDQVHDVYTCYAGQVTALARHAASAFLRGVVHIQDRSILLCDVAELPALIPGQQQDEA
jgi:purine-binding chemotaxis protein CheW